LFSAPCSIQSKITSCVAADKGGSPKGICTPAAGGVALILFQRKLAAASPGSTRTANPVPVHEGGTLIQELYTDPGVE
jgi:hypothetical protein